MLNEVPSARQRLGRTLVLLSRRWRRLLDHQLALIGLTDATWTPLIHLRESGDGITQKELALRVGLDGSSLVRLLDILAGQGLIERRADAQDRRANRIFLTQAGHQATQAIREKLNAAEFDMLADFDDAEIEAMLAAFARIDARINDLHQAQE